MIAVDNLTKSYGSQVLFDAVSFKINARERVGLVGRNGHGKTTLFRILVGEEEYDGGSVVLPKGYRIGYVQQQLAFSRPTVLEEGMQGLPASKRDHSWEVEKILAGLGFSNADMQRPPGDFSGGFQVRLNLAKVLVSEPDLLLLDEPTNYLDITSIRWIVRFLVAWPGELMLITHDRSFMDRVVTHTMGIYRCKVRKMTGDTLKFYTQIAQDEEIYEKTRINEERRVKEIEQFITRFRAKARLGGLVQSRVKTLEKLEKKDKLHKLRELAFSFRDRPFRGKQMLGVRDLTFAHPGHAPLFAGLDFTVNAGDRLCVIGPNGQGKTTLLQLLAGHLKPKAGAIAYHPGVVTGFYEQTNIQSLNDHHTVEEAIQCCHPDVDRQQARNICGAMLFEGDTALKKVAVLSGGEKARVMLGRLLATPLNLLLLDEPSNHLDLESCDAMLDAIDQFDGAVIMVTHNELFLHSLARRLVVFHQNQATLFEGTYQEFLDKGGWGDDNSGPTHTAAPIVAKAAAAPALSKKDLRRQRSAIISEHAKQSKPAETAITDLERGIEADEAQLAALNTDMIAASQSKSGDRIAQLSQSIHQCQQRIDARFAELEEWYQRKESLDQALAEKLGELE
ncbi:MAG: ABC-F family ATP-binding cassette domain-containing protein [Desulfatitalea sp.]|nr:ABC-F family ATP-binding cassette domain-containing protein [Desulfatitalea sp.]